MKKQLFSICRFAVSGLLRLLRSRACFPVLLLGAVYLLQLRFPEIHRLGALWKHPRVEMHGWQFITCAFLSGNAAHLLVNSLGLLILFCRIAPQVRFSKLLAGFLFFSVFPNLLYWCFAMPGRAWLVGASGGLYGLLGWLAWVDRQGRFSLFGLKSFRLSPGLFLLSALGLEALIGWLWLPALAWPLHMIAVGCGFCGAVVREGLGRLGRVLNMEPVPVSESEASL